MTQAIKGLEEVFSSYDGFILDLWGVVHDGVAPFKDTIPTLQLLKKAKRKVWLLSNAPRRSYTVVDKLTQMGVTPDLYNGIMTSGEMSWQCLKDELLAKWGRRAVHIGKDYDHSAWENLDVELVDDPAKADFVMNTGVRDFADTAEQYRPILEKCAERNLPMLCANPDKIVHVEKKLVICAGTLADMYEAMDGQVTSFGKPYRHVYRHCLSEMGGGNVLAVGDSMVTDIKGATGAGIDSALVMSGIHREEFDGKSVDAFMQGYPYSPTYVMNLFSW